MFSFTHHSGPNNSLNMENEEKIIYLNIGGYKYVTTRQTLLQGGKLNYFTALLSNKFALTLDKEGNVFIDRDGKYFEPILEYLRTGELHCDADAKEENIRREAEFYQISLPAVNKKKEKQYIYFRASGFSDDSIDINGGGQLQILTFKYKWLNAAIIEQPFIRKQQEYGEMAYYITDVEQFLQFMHRRNLTLEDYNISKPGDRCIHYFVYSFL